MVGVHGDKGLVDLLVWALEWGLNRGVVGFGWRLGKSNSGY